MKILIRLKMERKSSSLNVFDNLCDIKAGRDNWRIRVRVLRLWSVPAVLNPG